VSILRAVRAEFFRPDSPDQVVGVAEWDGRGARISTEDDEVRKTLERVFRPSPVAITDEALLPRGTRGETVIEPGDLQWFLAAARLRAEKEGLGVRLVTDTPGGWDPAGAYRPMGLWIADREGGVEPSRQPGLGTPSQ
jgi:hypothetical protein